MNMTLPTFSQKVKEDCQSGEQSPFIGISYSIDRSYAPRPRLRGVLGADVGKSCTAWQYLH